MSVEGIAARAGVGKTTIYRRWETKEDVIIEAIRSIHAKVPVIDTGNLRDDLIALTRGTQREAPRSAIERLLPRALSLAQTNPAVFEVYRERLIAPRLGLMRELIERAIERGEVRADLDPQVAVDVFAGAVFFRLLIASHITPTPQDFAEQLVDTIWRGLAAR
jgi:AcrR family transcriptional regulator